MMIFFFIYWVQELATMVLVSEIGSSWVFTKLTFVWYKARLIEHPTRIEMTAQLKGNQAASWPSRNGRRPLVFPNDEFKKKKVKEKKMSSS